MMTFGVEKLEWYGYPTVKKFWRYVCSFRQNEQTWQTDRQTDTTWWHGDTYAQHRMTQMTLTLSCILACKLVPDFSPTYITTMQKADICINVQALMWTHTHTHLYQTHHVFMW